MQKGVEIEAAASIHSMEELHEAEAVYEKWKREFHHEAHPETKLFLQEQLRKLHRAIELERERYAAVFWQQATSVRDKLAQVKEAIRQRSVEQAQHLFQQAREHFTMLPNMLHEQREQLEATLQDFGNAVDNLQKAEQEWQAKTTTIQQQVREALRQSRKGKRTEARVLYRTAVEAYRNLPQSKSRRKWETAHMLVETKELLEMNPEQAETFLSMLTAGKQYLPQQPQAAREAYLRALALLQELPPSFLHTNPQALHECNDLYQELLVKEVEREENRSEHLQLARLLAEIHEHVHRREFQTAKEKYLRMYHLSHKVGTKNRKVLRELNKLHALFAVLSLAENIPIHNSIQEVIAQAQELADRFPEERSFATFLQQKALAFKHLE